MGVAAGDLNGDGRSDVVLTDRINGYLYVLVTKPGGGFGEKIIATSSKCYSPGYPVIGDLNGDGHPDVLLGCVDGKAPVYVNDGSGTLTFETTLTEDVISDFMLPVIADVNGDGVPDVAILTDFEVAVLLGRGGLTYAPPFYLGTGVESSGLVTANLHGQSPLAGTPDFVVPDYSGKMLVLFNKHR